MTPAPWQGTRPPSRVRHTWRCTRRGALVETVKEDATGRARVVAMCQECGGSDVLDRIHAERRESTP